MNEQAADATIASRRAHIVRVVESLPGAEIEERGQHLSFAVAGKRFAWYLDDHHGDGRIALSCKGEPGVNAVLADAQPGRFHIPKYVGPRGWIGLWLDLPDIDLEEVDRLVRTAYRLAAPKRLSRGLP